MRWSFGAAAGLAAALIFAAPARAAVATIQIEGLPGGADSSPVELTSWSYDDAGHQGAASSGRAAGRANLGAFHITKPTDPASPKLMEAAANGRRFPLVVIAVRKSGGDSEPYLKYKLTDVMISNYQISSGGDRPSESMTLNYAKIEVIDHSQTTQETGVERAGLIPRASHLPPPGHE